MKKSKGVLTLEAALIMPLIIYVVLIMIFLSMLIYTRTYVSLSTNYIVSTMTNDWYSIETKGGLIGGLFGTKSALQEKKAAIEKMIVDKINSGAPMSVESKVDVDPTSYLIGDRLEIKVEAKYKMPLPGLFKMFGLADSEGKVTDTYTKVVRLSNAESNMRVISYGKDLISRISEKLDLDGILSKIKELLGRG